MATIPQRLARLTSVPTEMEAAIIVAALEEAGIRATLTGAYTAGFRAEAPGWVQILVGEEDLAAAQRIAANFTEAPANIDWSQVDVGETDEQ